MIYVGSYLTKRVQDGEIQHQSAIEAAQQLTVLANAKELVRFGLESGLLKYPEHTEEVVQLKTKSLSEYPCLKAWRMRQKGKTIREIAKVIHCANERLTAVLVEGKRIAEAAAKGKSSKQTAKESFSQPQNSGKREGRPTAKRKLR